MHALASLAMYRAQAIGTGVAAAYDDHMLVFRGEEIAVVRVSRHSPVLKCQEIHRELDALELSSLDGKIARLGRSATEANRVEFLKELVVAEIDPDIGAGLENDSFGPHLVEAAVEESLLHL